MQTMEERVEALERAVGDLKAELAGIQFNLIGVLGPKKKPKENNSGGAAVWDSYNTAFQARYKVRPVRNAKVNAQAAEIARRLGYEDAVAVAKFYLTLTDPQFLRMNHPLGTLLMHCESIHSMWRRGQMTTSAEARRLEQRSGNLAASSNYLNRKYGPDETK